MSRKRVVYIKTVNQLWLDIARKLEQTHGWEPVLWVGQNAEMMAEARPAALYEHSDAMRGIDPSEFELIKEDPLDPDTLSRLSRYEPIFFDMMNRWCCAPDNISFEDRRLYYLLMLRLWIRMLKTVKADMVLCPTIPHRVYDFVAYLATKVLDIPYLVIEQVADIRCAEDGTMNAWFYAISDIENRSQRFVDAMDGSAKSAELSDDGARYLARAKGDYDAVIPSYILKKRKQAAQKAPLWRRLYDSLPFSSHIAIHTVRNLLTNPGGRTGKLIFSNDHTRDGDTPDFAKPFTAMLQQRKIRKNVIDAVKWYNENAAAPDLSKPFIYFASSYQPERSTNPDAGLYQNLELILEVISGALPKDWVVYYKEHPTNFRRPYRADNMRNIAYYKRLKKVCPQISFLPLSQDPFSMIDQANAVATATGTTGWEALVRGKPALLFGDNWYRNCPGIFRISSLEECQQAFREIEKGFEPDQEKIRAYMTAVEQECCDLSFRRSNSFLKLKQSDPDKYDAGITTFAGAFKTGYDYYMKTFAKTEQNAVQEQPESQVSQA